jgi:hypothetical protein
VLGAAAVVGGPFAAHAASFNVKTASAAPQIAFDREGVDISGISRGADVFVLSVWREGDPWSITNVSRKHWLVQDEDRDGLVQIDLRRSVPLQSIWGIVDLTSGRGLLAVPEDYRLWEIPTKDLFLDVSEGSLGIRRTSLELAVIRAGPKNGFWRHEARDGSLDDEDGRADKIVQVTLESFRSPEDTRDSGPPPTKLEPGDVIFAIDTRTMEVAAVEVE